MNKRTNATGLGVAMILSGFMFGLSVSAWAQQTDSRLYHITKSGILRVCQWPQYYAISYRNPSTGQIEGIDADLANELAKELGAKLEIVDSSFVTFVADLQTNKCDIGMFGVGATLKRAQAVEFSKPYLTIGIYAIVKKNGPIKTWADIDKPGIRVADTLGSYSEPFMRSYLKHATLHAVSAPATNEGELRANRADASVADYPSALRVHDEFDWATVLAPPQPLRETSYAYVVAPGDQVWLNYVNLFVDTVKLDGRLKEFADKHGLGPVISK